MTLNRPRLIDLLVVIFLFSGVIGLIMISRMNKNGIIRYNQPRIEQQGYGIEDIQMIVHQEQQGLEDFDEPRIISADRAVNDSGRSRDTVEKILMIIVIVSFQVSLMRWLAR